MAPHLEALDRLLELVDRLAEEGIVIHHLDPGGGLGIRYRDEQVASMAEFAAALESRLGGRELELLVEPGRSIVGNAGVMLTRVEYLKRGAERDFALVDAAMNDLLRPALYDAWHDIVPVRQPSQGDGLRSAHVTGGSTRSPAYSEATVSRSRTRCAAAPSTITSAARGRAL